jgi:hypothetical protein
MLGSQEHHHQQQQQQQMPSHATSPLLVHPWQGAGVLNQPPALLLLLLLPYH